MKLETLEEKIAIRADAVIQARIKVFKADIEEALKKLFGSGGNDGVQFGQYGYSELPDRLRRKEYRVTRGKLAVLRLAIREVDETPLRNKIGFPAVLWEIERNTIRDELLSKLDLMQKLLLSPPRDTTDDVPCEGDSVE